MIAPDALSAAAWRSWTESLEAEFDRQEREWKRKDSLGITPERLLLRPSPLRSGQQPPLCKK